MKQIKIFILVAILAFLPCSEAQAASAKTWVIVSKTYTIKDSVYKTAEGMCVDPKDNAIYSIQKKPGEEICELYKNGKLVKGAFKGKDASGLIGHGNDLAYYNDHIYVADYKKSSIHRLKRKGSAYEYDKSYSYSGGDRVWNIATYKKAKVNGSEKQLFILGLGPIDGRKQYKFAISYFEGSTFKPVAYFYVKNPNSDPSSKSQTNLLQGIVYNEKTGWLHIGLSAEKYTDKNGKNVECTKNSVISIKVTHVTGTKTYSKGDQVIRSFNSPSGRKFELESLAIDTNGKFYALVNSGGDADEIYHIKTQ